MPTDTRRTGGFPRSGEQNEPLPATTTQRKFPGKSPSKPKIIPEIRSHSTEIQNLLSSQSTQTPGQLLLLVRERSQTRREQPLPEAMPPTARERKSHAGQGIRKGNAVQKPTARRLARKNREPNMQHPPNENGRGLL